MQRTGRKGAVMVSVSWVTALTMARGDAAQEPGRNGAMVPVTERYDHEGGEEDDRDGWGCASGTVQTRSRRRRDGD